MMRLLFLRGGDRSAGGRRSDGDYGGDDGG